MLVDPVLVRRPGDNGTPSGGCQFCGANLPPQGDIREFACYMGEFYCRSCVKQFAKSFDLLISDDAQAKFEAFAHRLALSETESASARSELAELRSELADEQQARAAADETVAVLQAELASTKSYADVVAGYLEKTSPKKTKETK